MANVKSQAQTNQEAQPIVFNDPPTQAAETRTIIVQTSVGDNANGDTHEIIRLPSRTRLYDVLTVRGAHTGATDVSMGFRFPLRGGAPTQISAAADECLFDSADISGAQTLWASVLGFGTNGIPVTSFGKMLWEMAGLATDPLRDMCIFLLFTVGTTAAGPFLAAYRFQITGEN